MDGLHYNPQVPCTSNPSQDSGFVSTIKTHTFAGRNVEINHEKIIAICTTDNQPFNEQVNTLFAVTRHSRFSPSLDNACDKKIFDRWFLGQHCMINKPDFLCHCYAVHQIYPGEKVGGVLIENQRLNQETASANASALLSLAACRLIESERLLNLSVLQAKEKTTSPIIISMAEKKYQESEDLLKKAHEINPELARKQIRSWLIQYALNNRLIHKANDIEKIKNFRTTFQNKVSDLLFKVLIESGFYPNTELLASPLYLAGQLIKISHELVRVNNFYPWIGRDSAILLFSMTDSLMPQMQQLGSFLPVPDNEHGILFSALWVAIFADRARIHSQTTSFLEGLRRSPASSGAAKTTRKTKAITRSTKVMLLHDTGLEYMGVKVKAKKPGQAETSAFWSTEREPFVEPTDLVTAFANVFNIMTYPKSDDKTRIYNMPNHREQMARAYDLLDQFLQSDESIADNLHGYTCFLMGWLHEQKLIDHSTPIKAALFYEKATERGLFIPLALKSGDLFAEMGDYHSACRCYENMYQNLKRLASPVVTEKNNSDFSDGQEADQSGYLSQYFLDFLLSKIECSKIKAKDTVYLRSLTPEEIQRYINGEENRASPPYSQGKPERVKNTQNKYLTKPHQESGKETVSDCPCRETECEPGEIETMGMESNSKNPVSKIIDSEDCSVSACNTTASEYPQIKTVDITENNPGRANIIRNRLTIKWDRSVHTALKNFSDRKKSAIYSHAQNIVWLNNELSTLKKKKGIEALKEHLAWEYIHIAEQAQFDGSAIDAKQVKEHLDRAESLLLENIIIKTGIPYPKLPEPEKFEADVLDIVKTVTSELQAIELAEWLFGIVCQARSLGHVFSIFKLLYPKSEHITSLNRGWFSLKYLYRTS